MILLDNRAVEDLQTIRVQDGHEVMLMLFEACQQLDEAATRIMAERLSEKDALFRLRVEDYHITFQLIESDEGNAVHITRVRRRHRDLPAL